MTLAKSLALFDDCREVLDAALVQEGLEVNCETYARAVVFRRRCNHFRVLDRESNLEIYSNGPMHGRSVYDTLELCIKGRSPTVVIRPRQSMGPYQTGPLGTFTGAGAKPPNEG